MTALERGGCQVVDVTHDAKARILQLLEEIAERQGRPVLQPQLLTVADREAYAAEHVGRCQVRPEFAGVAAEVHVAEVISHVTPLPADREWALRSRMTTSARRRARVLERASACDSLAVEARQRAESAYAAWAHLNGLHLAGQGEEGDLVSECLADDMSADEVA